MPQKNGLNLAVSLILCGRPPEKLYLIDWVNSLKNKIEDEVLIFYLLLNVIRYFHNSLSFFRYCWRIGQRIFFSSCSRKEFSVRYKKKQVVIWYFPFYFPLFYIFRWLVLALKLQILPNGILLIPIPCFIFLGESPEVKKN